MPEVFVLCEHNTKKCLSKYAVNSFDEMMLRFKKLIEKTEPFGAFSFACVSPYDPDNEFFVKRHPRILNDDAEPVDMEFNHEDFCILMKPITNKGCSVLGINYNFPFFFQCEISLNTSWEQTGQISEETHSIIEQHDYPRTYLIRRAHRKFIFLPQWQKMLIVGGVAAIGLGALGYYGGLAFYNSSYYNNSGIKKFCDFFNYKQLNLSE
jgi:hypothetical protein